ncbi:uncharacterized protein LOC127265021 isoform X2 [Andrographis paniculata]|nr:uncharacterized protein LOC127265021 isoform X2 [Andrographis paniculata]
MICGGLDETISDGSFSRFTFDMMLAWEMPTSAQEASYTLTESVRKEREEKLVLSGTDEFQDDIPLFYSDLLPLLVDGEPSVGADAFVWLAITVPLVVDTVNGRFTFETLTSPTGNRLHYPAYDKFLKEIHKCMKHLHNQETPKGIELTDGEFILHVEGTPTSQRVVRHIGGTSWPGRLTLTNNALYFEASGVVSYEDAMKLDLSKDTEQNVKPAATGPWGAPLFDKAIVYEASDLQEAVVLEFPEMTSSTRRDHWLALIKEVMLLHRFLSKFKVESVEMWEMHARTILGIIRLHAAREMLRISPPEPKNFLIFVLLDELPKGDYVLQELAQTLNNLTTRHPCTATSILNNFNISRASIPFVDDTQEINANNSEIVRPENISSLESAVNRAREEGKEMDMAKATAVSIKEEGISESAQVLLGLLKPLLRIVVPFARRIFTWEQPGTTCIVMIATLGIIYKELVGLSFSAFLLCGVANMLWTRQKMIPEEHEKICIQSGPDQVTIESIVSAQHALRSIHEIMQLVNITVLKIWSVLISKAPKHTNRVMMVMTFLAAVLAMVPLKFIVIAMVLCFFFGKQLQSEKGNRRLREWWESIPIIPVEIVDKG